MLKKIFFLSGMFLLLQGCEEKKALPKPAMMIPEVTAFHVVPQRIVVDQEFVAETDSYRTVDIRGRVEGILFKQFFQEGQPVQEGDLLFTIDPRPFEAQLQKAKAFLAESVANYKNAKKNNLRLKSLVKQKAVSQKDADDAEAAALMTEATVESAKAQLKEAELNLEYTYITSPLSGITSMFLKKEGDLIIPGPGDSSLLTQVTQLDPIYANFYVTDKELQESRHLFQKKEFVSKPLKTSIFLSDGSLYPEKGSITFSDPLMKKEMGAFLMRAEFPNPAHLLKPGQYVKLKIEGLALSNAILVPQRSIVQKNNQYQLFVIEEDQKVSLRTVQGKNWNENQFWVREGLQPNACIVVDGVLKLKPGMLVKINSFLSKDGTKVKSQKHDLKKETNKKETK